MWEALRMGFSRLNVVEKIDSTQTYLYSQLTTPGGLLRLDAPPAAGLTYRRCEPLAKPPGADAADAAG